MFIHTVWDLGLGLVVSGNQRMHYIGIVRGGNSHVPYSPSKLSFLQLDTKTYGVSKN